MQPVSEYYSLIIYTLATLLLIGGMLFAAWWLGAKTTNGNKELAYESGVIPTGSARLPLFIPFYLHCHILHCLRRGDVFYLYLGRRLGAVGTWRFDPYHLFYHCAAVGTCLDLAEGRIGVGPFQDAKG